MGRDCTTTKPSLTFAELLEKARHLEKEALTTLYERAVPVIYRYVFARLAHRDLVEDIVAEIFLEMVESIPTLHTSQEAGFYAWLFRIAHAKLIKARHRIGQIGATHQPLPDPTSDAHPDLQSDDWTSDPVAWQEWREHVSELALALDTLTPDQQFVVIGRFLAGQSIDELAQSLAKSPGTIRALQFRALRSLAKKLTRAGHDPIQGGR